MQRRLNVIKTIMGWESKLIWKKAQRVQLNGMKKLAAKDKGVCQC